MRDPLTRKQEAEVEWYFEQHLGFFSHTEGIRARKKLPATLPRNGSPFSSTSSWINKDVYAEFQSSVEGGSGAGAD